MTNIFNETIYASSADSGSVYYDNHNQRFYTVHNGQSMLINQQTEFEDPLIDQDTLSKFYEMINDWEREKYPERFL